MLAFGFIPDFQAEEFDFFRSVSWTHLIFFAFLEVFLISKCIFEKLKTVIAERERLISVEVLPIEQPIDRKIAKKNLREVVIRCDPKSGSGSIFDKTWYIRRGAVHESKKADSCFVVDVRFPSLV